MTDPAQALFDRLASAYAHRPGVRLGQVWHNKGLTVHDKIFAMVVRGRLVVKLPAAQAQALIADGHAAAFEPRPGRRMKEWVAVDLPADAQRWRQLMDDACSYVAAQTSAVRAESAFGGADRAHAIPSAPAAPDHPCAGEGGAAPTPGPAPGS